MATESVKRKKSRWIFFRLKRGSDLIPQQENLHCDQVAWRDMKFGQQFIEEQGQAPVTFQKSFIRYKALKKYLKYRSLNRESQSSTPGFELKEEQAEKDFLRMLYDQLKEVDRIFEKEAHKVIATYEIQNSDCQCLVALLRCQPLQCLPKAPADTALQARWCRRYAELNYIALRKIAKKRDRLLGGRLGAEFMQACFRGEMQARTFMSASLLAELKAIESIMTEKANEGCTPSMEVDLAQRTSNLDEAMRAATLAGPVAEEMSDEFDSDLMCAICLDLLYQPVSLSCGHQFCARCALAAAIGNDRMIGNAEHLLLSVACYSTERPCPCCRTVEFGSRRNKHSPFYDITRLTKLEDLIKKKHPEDWERRKQEDAEHQAFLKSARPSTWTSLRHMLT